MNYLKNCATIFISIVAFTAIGVVVPLMFDRDVAGAAAAGIFSILGLVVGTFVGLMTVIRRRQKLKT